MRILIIQDYLRCGGTERQTLFLGELFHEEGIDVLLLTFRPGGRLAVNFEENGLPHDSLRKADGGFSFFAPGLIGRIGKWGPDVVLCMGRMANCYAGFVQRKYPSLPIIGSVRTGKKLPFLYRWSLRKVKGVLVNSVWWKERLLAAGLEGEKINVVYNSLLLPEKSKKISSAGRELRAACGLSKASCVFLNIAGFRRGKRQSRLLKLFSAFDTDEERQLWLVGEGRALEDCRKLARHYGLGDKVRFFGYRSDIRNFYEGADVAVSASMEDALPNFIIEAQAMGLPVVATASGGVREAFRPDETGFLISPEDDHAFLHAMRQLCESKTMRMEFGRKAVSFAEERFSSLRQGRKVLDFLRSQVRGVKHSF